MAESLKASPPAKLITYSYVALDTANKPVKGTIKATSEALAGRLITERGLRPVSVEPAPSRLALDQALPSLFGIKPREVNAFSRQLATLIEAGITITASLELMYQQSSSRAFKKVLSTIGDDLRSGLSFSQALTKHPTVFDEIYCRTIGLAEQTGRLEVIMRQIADFQEKQAEAMKKLKNALTYPAVVLSLGIVVAIILMTTALPALIDMFEQMKVDLPLPTRILIWVSNFINGNILYLAGGAGALALLAIYFVKQPTGRLRFDRFLLRAPVIGPPAHSAVIGRFSRTTSILLGAGLSLQEIMELVPSTIGNRAMRQSLSNVSQELVRGEGMSEPMAKDNLFPPLLTQMVMVGEESNTLDSSLSVAADFYETDSSERVGAMVRIITPAATVLIAALVGFMAVAVILPMYSITGAFE